MADKKKLAASAVAVTTAAALLLGGTFAWQSISQTALNEASDVINPGGRLHDDFNGESKDVFVENFAEDEIFARIRLDEYFEIIMNYNGGDAEKSEVIAGETREDTSTYETHIFGEENATDEWWTWTTGSAESGEVYYMPTFNVNKDSLVADVNGVFDGANFNITDRDHDQYENFVDYSEVTEKTGNEIYDYDGNDNDELDYLTAEELNEIIANGEGAAAWNADFENAVKLESATHEAQTVGETKGLISMYDWLTMVNDYGEYDEETHGGYWVYDTDGWVYWSSPIPAGETTGLLLDGIALNQVMDDTWYYAINVVAQFVTADDVGKTDGSGFYSDVAQKPSADAETLLEKIGVDMSGEAPGDGDETSSGFHFEASTTTIPVGGSVVLSVYDNNNNLISSIAELEDISLNISFTSSNAGTSDFLNYTLNDDGTVTIIASEGFPNDHPFNVMGSMTGEDGKNYSTFFRLTSGFQQTVEVSITAADAEGNPIGYKIPAGVEKVYLTATVTKGGEAVSDPELVWGIKCEGWNLDYTLPNPNARFMVSPGLSWPEDSTSTSSVILDMGINNESPEITVTATWNDEDGNPHTATRDFYALGADTTAPTVSVNGGVGEQVITISSVSAGDYPLTVELYAVNNQDPYNNGHPLNSVTIINENGELKYNQTLDSDAKIESLETTESGDIVLKSSYVPVNTCYFGVKVIDAQENSNTSDVIWIEVSSEGPEMPF